LRQRQGCTHEDDCRPCGEPREHVGGSARAKGGLRTLASKGAGKIGRAALLQQNNSDEKQAHDDMKDDNKVEKNLHCFSCFQKPSRLHRTGELFGAEEGIRLRLPKSFLQEQ
jgi:hypothetical protein